MANSQSVPDRTIFRFFDLPRELRDQIYEDPALLTTTDHLARPTRSPQHDKPTIMVSTSLNTNLLLVSRRFSAEYNKRAAPKCHFAFGIPNTSSFDNIHDGKVRLGVERLPLQPIRVPSLELCIQLPRSYWWEDGFDSDVYAARVTNTLIGMIQRLPTLLAHFHGLERISLRLRTSFDTRIYQKWLTEVLPLCCEIESMYQVEVIDNWRYCAVVWHGYPVIARWKRGEGLELLTKID